MIIALLALLTPQTIDLAAVGDVMLGRYVGRRIAVEGADAVFASVAPELRRADITFGNLECVLSNKPFTVSKRVSLRAEASSAVALGKAGFDVMSVANNHSLDGGLPGLNDTLSTLRAADVSTIGVAPEPLMVERNGLKVAFLAYCDFPAGPGIQYTNETRLTKDISGARAMADFVVVSWHWGDELTSKVTPRQEKLARLASEAGADVVLGHHPHVLQKIAWVAGRSEHRCLVAYSLGNFVFDGKTIAERETGILHVTLGKGGVSDYRLDPFRIVDGFPKK